MAKRHRARFRAQAQAQRDADRIRGQVDAIREAFAMDHIPAPVIPKGTGAQYPPIVRLPRRKPSTTVRVAELTLWDESGTPIAAGKLVSHYGNVTSPIMARDREGFASNPILAPNHSHAEPYRPWYSALFATIDEGCARMDDRTRVRSWLARNAWREGN